MPQIQTIKPVKLEAIRKGLQEIYNINDISTANLNNLNVNSLGKIFTKILTSETIKGQSITQNSKNCQIFNPNLSPNFYNSLYKASEYVLISKFIVFLLNFFNYSDAEVCLPVCMFYEPNMVMIKKVLTALLKVGRFCQENKNRIGLTEEELKCTMKNQTILNEKCQSKQQTLNKKLEDLEDLQIEYRDTEKQSNQLNNKKLQFQQESSELNQELLNWDQKLSEINNKNLPILNLIESKKISLEGKVKEIDEDGTFKKRLKDIVDNNLEKKIQRDVQRESKDANTRKLSKSKKAVELIKSIAANLNNYEAAIRFNKDKENNIETLTQNEAKLKNEIIKMDDLEVKLMKDIEKLREELNLKEEDSLLLKKEAEGIANNRNLEEKNDKVSEEECSLMEKLKELTTLSNFCQKILSKPENDELNKTNIFLTKQLEDNFYKVILPMIMRALRDTSTPYMEADDLEDYLSVKLGEFGVEYDNDKIEF